MQRAAALTAVRPTRRTVTRAAAWSVPVIAVAATAPAYAASCASVRVAQSHITGYDRVSSVEWTATYDFDGASGPLPANVMTARASYDSGMAVRNDNNGGANDNFSIAGSVGGLGTNGLVMAQRASTKKPSTAFGHYTFGFSKPVTGLSFTLTDIDSATGDFWDSVWLTPGFTASAKASGLRGVGTAADPFKQSNGNTSVNNSSGGAGNITITYPATISSFTLNYSNAATGFDSDLDPDQVVTIANLSFNFQPC